MKHRLKRLWQSVSPGYRKVCQVEELVRGLSRRLADGDLGGRIVAVRDELKHEIFELKLDLHALASINRGALNTDLVLDTDLGGLGRLRIATNLENLAFTKTQVREILLPNAFDPAGRSPYNFHPVQAGEGAVILDVGANIGAASMVLSRLYPAAVILAFEPSPAVFGYLRRNLELNGCANVRAFNLAVTADGRDVDFSTFALFHAGSRLTALESGLINRSREFDVGMLEDIQRVPSVSLDQIFERHGIRRCRFLKLDCEGAEYEILSGTKRLGDIDRIAGETHGDRERTVQLFRLLKRHIPKDRMAFCVSGSRRFGYGYGEIEEDELFC